ncbi:MAG: S8 family serine peptidase [Elainellaceae cyanobacterium]
MTQQQTIKRLIGLLGIVSASLIGAPVLALVRSVGEDGIDAHRLHAPPYNLIGRKISIGQVEIGRPAVFGLDKAANSNQVVNLGQVLYRDGRATADELVDGHAANVASVMVSSDKRLTGVAPGARLYSSAVGFIERNGQPQECLSTQAVAQQNSGDVRAINFSFGESLARDPRPDATLDGNALLTQCIDWSSNVHDVLYVIAGNQGRGGIPIPTDNFNGMNVTNSTMVAGRFAKVSFSSLSSEPPVVIGRLPDLESNVGPRRSISITAPGSNIEMLNPDGTTAIATGTSFAAPHVTAMVALLQEYGDSAIRRSHAGLAPDATLGDRPLELRHPEWTLDARNPQVMKAVLMNSADKIQDTGDGLNLGMSRTVYDQTNKTWLDSDAYTDPEKPLSAELGTGHLNAYRAYQQFSAGQWSPDDEIPVIGWDYHTVSPASRNDEPPKFRDYVLEQSLEADSFVSITLAWNRYVTLNDENSNGRYDIGETFDDQGLNDLNLYLMPADEDDIDASIWSSVSEVDSIEHIFQKIPESGRYKIRVVYANQVNDEVQPYALAWWTAPDRLPASE